MTIAVMMDFEGECLSRRDGIFLHLYHLMSAWLEYNEEINVEIWVFSHSQKAAEVFCEDLKKRFGERITVHSDVDYPNINCVKSCCLRGIERALKGVVRQFSSHPMDGIKRAIAHKAEVYGRKSEEAKHDFIKSFKSIFSLNRILAFSSYSSAIFLYLLINSRC